MNKRDKEILAKIIALLHGFLTTYIIATTVWFLITFKLNTYVIVALALGVWVMFIQRLIIGGCPLTFIENRLRGLEKQDKFMIRFWSFLGIKIKQEEKTWWILRWGSVSIFFLVLTIRLVLV